MKHFALWLLLVGCVHGSTAAPTFPNRVCMMIALDSPGARCTDAGTSSLHGDVARRDEDGGTKVCWESFNQNGYECATPVLSKKETAANAIKIERDRAKAEADAKARAEAESPKIPKESEAATPAKPADAKPTKKP